MLLLASEKKRMSKIDPTKLTPEGDEGMLRGVSKYLDERITFGKVAA